MRYVNAFLITFVYFIHPSWQQQNDLLLLSYDTFINQIDPITGDMKLIHNANTTGGPISSLEFDVRNNCIFFGIHTPHQMTSNKIIQKCLNDNQDERIVADVLSYHTSLAFDWSTDLLYFVESKLDNFEIEVIKIVRSSENHTTPLNYMRRTIITDPHLRCYLCHIAIHPVKQFIFWTSGTVTKSGIRRSNTDGTENLIIVGTDVASSPTQMTIDFDFDRIYWLDHHKHIIGRSDFNGNSIELFELTQPHRPMRTTALTISTDRIYWNNKHFEEIYSANKGKLIFFKYQ